MDPALAVIVSAVVSAIAGIGVLLIGRRIDKRYGLPSDFETRMAKQRETYQELLEAEVSQRRAAQTECEEQLSELQSDHSRSLSRIDDLEETVLRLRIRLGDGSGKP